MRNFVVGSRDPAVHVDVGAGYGRPTPGERALWVGHKTILLHWLPAAAVVLGKDAARHMGHYLDGSGRDLNVDLERLISDVSTAKGALDDELNAARLFVQTLPVGSHAIVAQLPRRGIVYAHESRNWHFAIGWYWAWGKGTATVRKEASSLKYGLDFEYRIFDRYNWDRGKSVRLLDCGPPWLRKSFTVTDDFMGEFQRTGLAREFNVTGSVKRAINW